MLDFPHHYAVFVKMSIKKHLNFEMQICKKRNRIESSVSHINYSLLSAKDNKTVRLFVVCSRWLVVIESYAVFNVTIILDIEVKKLFEGFSEMAFVTKSAQSCHLGGWQVLLDKHFFGICHTHIQQLFRKGYTCVVLVY